MKNAYFTGAARRRAFLVFTAGLCFPAVFFARGDCLHWPAASNLDGSVARNKFVTPSKRDYKNDKFVFSCYNPRDLKVAGKIFDLRGRKIADMKLNDVDGSDFFTDIEWDPNRSDAGRAPGGVYVYQITAGETVYTGTVVVIR